MLGKLVWISAAVHDMVILAASVRRNGRSLARIARDEIGLAGGLAASLAILFILIVALAGLGLAVVNSLARSPWGTFTIFLTIPITCGAVSGVHSLISSGTAPKMIMSEREIPMIGFGATLAEGFVAVRALLAVVTLCDMLLTWHGYLTERRPITTSEVLELEEAA